MILAGCEGEARAKTTFFPALPLRNKSKGKRQLFKGISRLFFLQAVFSPFYPLVPERSGELGKRAVF